MIVSISIDKDLVDRCKKAASDDRRTFSNWACLALKEKLSAGRAVVEVKEKKPKKIFTPPTIEAVSEYCSNRGSGVDARKWYDFYQSKGWMVGKNKMKDWKAAVRTWERKSETHKTASGNHQRIDHNSHSWDIPE
jgi:hypothetical protein